MKSRLESIRLGALGVSEPVIKDVSLGLYSRRATSSKTYEMA